MRYRPPSKPTKRSIATRLALMAGDVAAIQAAAAKEAARPPRTKPKRQRESREVNDLVPDLMREYRNVKLYRNSKGMGYYQNGTPTKIGLGPRGFADYVGYVSIVVTPDLVGKRLAVFAAPECKTPENELDTDQAARAREIIEAGGLAGCVRDWETFLRVLKLA